MKKIIFNSKEERIKTESAIFWSKIAEHLPDSFERAALGDKTIYRAFFEAYLEFRIFFIENNKENIINLIKNKWESWEDINREELIKLLKSHEEN